MSLSSSPSKVFVHIGLPKTATTTLQYEFFPKFNNSNIVYVGLRTPRRQKQSLLFEYFDKAVRLGEDIEQANILLKSELQKRKSILVSDELCLVSHKEQGSWREKMARLHKLLSGCQHAILVTVREPAEASFSYYVQMYHNFRKVKTPFLSLVKDSEAMEIYHYGKLIHELERYFHRDCLHFIPFEKIINNDLGGFDMLFSYSKERKNDTLSSHRNFRPKDSKVVKRNYSRSLGSILDKFFPGTGALSLLPNPIKNKLMSVVKRLLGTQISKPFVIERPSDSEMQAIRQYLQDETAALKEFGVDYSN